MPVHISQYARRGIFSSHEDRQAQKSAPAPEQNPSFSHGEQARRLAARFAIHWLITAIFCGCFSGAVAGFARKPFQLVVDKHNFNAIDLGLIICLSLNLFSSLNAFARAWKWRLLNKRTHAPEIFQLLLTFDTSQTKSIRILFGRRSSLWLRLVTVCWLLVNIAAQVATAAIGLTYSMDSQGRTSTIPFTMGTATTTVFTTIRNDGLLNGNVQPADTPANLTAQRRFSFAYGIGAVNEGFGEFIPSNLTDPNTVAFDSENKMYVKNITDYSPWQPPYYQHTLDNDFFVVSERYVTNRATCKEMELLDAEDALGITRIVFNTTNGVRNFTLQHGTDVTIAYISDTEGGCGARCTHIYAFLQINDTQTLFTCNSTVSPILYSSDDQPVTRPELMLPDQQARILAGGPGWGGIEVSTTLDGTSQGTDRFQAATYGNESAYAPTYKIDANSFANGYVALFPAITMNVMDAFGPRVEVDNIAARLDASDLHVEWRLIETLIGLIVGVQALLAMITVFAVYYYRVVVHDDSPFAMTTMLAPLVAHTPAGTMDGGNEIATTIDGRLRVTNGSEARRVTVLHASSIWRGTGNIAIATATGIRQRSMGSGTAVPRPEQVSYAFKGGVRRDNRGAPDHQRPMW